MQSGRASERSTFPAWKISICILLQKWGLATLAFGVSGYIWDSLTALIPLQQRQSNLCMFLWHGKANLLTLCLSCHKQRFQVWNITTSGVWEKTKACFNFESILGRRFPVMVCYRIIMWHDCADKNETIIRKLHKVREIKLQIISEGHYREKRRSEPLTIKRQAHAWIRSWYQQAKESHCNPSDMLWLISSNSHTYSKYFVASRASFMTSLLQSIPCCNFNRKSHFSVHNYMYLWVNTLSSRVLKSSYSDKCSNPFLGQ